MSKHSRKSTVEVQKHEEVNYKYLDFLGFTAYRIGDDDRLWSCLRWTKKGIERNKPGIYFLSSEGKRLNPWKMGLGYLGVMLRNPEEGTRKKFYIHNLVLLAFVGPCPKGQTACHNNGVPKDNRLSNLRWDTVSNNMKDKVRHGTQTRGESHPITKLTEDSVKEIRDLYATKWYSQSDLADRFGVSRGTIESIVQGKIWKHLL